MKLFNHSGDTSEKRLGAPSENQRWWREWRSWSWVCQVLSGTGTLERRGLGVGGAGWILPIHCFSGSVVCSWLISFLSWLPSASEASAFGTWALLASVAFEGYLQTASFNFILKQWFKKKCLETAQSLFFPNPRRKDVQKQAKTGLFLLKGLCSWPCPSFSRGPCRASKQSYKTESSVLFPQDSQDPELSHDLILLFYTTF